MTETPPDPHDERTDPEPTADEGNMMSPDEYEDEFVDPSEGDVDRDENGDPIPQVTEAGHLGKVKAKPMPYGKVQSYFGSGRRSNLEPEDLAVLFGEHITKPNLNKHYGGRVDADDVKGMKPLTPKGYLTAILEVSGVDPETVQMYDDGSAEVTVEGN